MDMTPVQKKYTSAHAYSINDICHTSSMNIVPHEECNTYNHGSSKYRPQEVKGEISAYLVSSCKFNEQFWCKTSNTSGQLL